MRFKNLALTFFAIAFCLTQFSCISSSTYRAAQPKPFFSDLALPPPSKNGECYVKYVTKDIYKAEKTEYFVFTGTDMMENKYIETKTVVISPKTSKWVKKKKYPDCVSSNPHDCIVACFEETPEVTKMLNIVTDTTQVKDFKVETIEFKKLIEKGGQQMWLGVVCRNKLTPNFIKRLQRALQEIGSYDGEISGELFGDTLESLKAYQTNHNLPVGFVDLESMRSLGL